MSRFKRDVKLLTRKFTQLNALADKRSETLKTLPWLPSSRGGKAEEAAYFHKF